MQVTHVIKIFLVSRLKSKTKQVKFNSITYQILFQHIINERIKLFYIFYLY